MGPDNVGPFDEVSSQGAIGEKQRKAEHPGDGKRYRQTQSGKRQKKQVGLRYRFLVCHDYPHRYIRVFALLVKRHYRRTARTIVQLLISGDLARLRKNA